MREIPIGEYIKNYRRKREITQEELCSGICSVSTLSRLELGKQTPSRDTLRALLHRLGLPEDRVFVLVSEHELEIQTLKQAIQFGLVEFEKADENDRPQIREQTAADIKQLEEIVEEEDVISRQYILSARVTLGTQEGPYSPAQRRNLLEKAIRMTVPQFQLDKVGEFRYRLLEITLLNKLARTFSMERKRGDAIALYERLLQNIKENACELEDYPRQFCLIANNYAINLALSERYQDALELAEQGRQVCAKYGISDFLPNFFATQAECQFFLGEREKSIRLYIQAGCLLDAVGDKHNLKILRKELRERLGMELPI